LAEAGRFSVIVMAAQRSGVVNPLAERAGVSHKCLVPICGRPLIAYVFDVLAATPGVDRVRVCVEPEAFEPVRALAGSLAAKAIPLEFVASAPSLADSAYAAAEGLPGAFLITTADNVNMTPEAVLQVMGTVAGGAEVVLALASREAVLAARGEVAGPNTAIVGPYRFSDGRFSNCNLYALAGTPVLKAAEMFREGGQFSKKRDRLIRAVGRFNVLLYLARLLSLRGAMKRLSKRFAMKVEATVLADGSQAIDVDNFRTYDLAEKILQAKASAR
jgi:GTP:adenosylcobinamide-phosphate guanylyltransferase